MHTDRRTFLKLMASGCARPLLAQQPANAPLPNIVLILADDIGYGDLGCYGASRVATPNIDKLAAGGVRFTDAHSSSATCTPSRYSLVTGEYAWRRPGTSILPGDANLIIDPSRATLPSVLRQAGYAAGCVGKWHLGLGKGPIDWNGELAPGPLEVGFDYAFVIPATGDRVPCVFVENHRVYGLDPKDPIRVSYREKIGDEPTGRERPDLLRMKLSEGHDGTIVNGISRIGWMTGGKAARWVDEDIAQVLTSKATAFIERNQARPFFLYFATHDIHVPRVPHGEFRGTSRCGLRCDAIQQFDYCVGRIVSALERSGIAQNTLLLVTSDNGPVVDDGYADGSVQALDGHKPAGPLRGGKYTLWEGGTRMPLIASWPARIRPAVSPALLAHVDFTASLAALAARPVASPGAPDSVNVLAALLGESRQGRDSLVEQGGGLALRQGRWKLVPAGEPRGDKQSAAQTELYDLDQDIGETRDVAAANPEVVRRMSALLDRVRTAPPAR